MELLVHWKGSRTVAYLFLFSAIWTSCVIKGLDDVRLVNGSTIYEGRVEILKDGDWAQVCDAAWDINEAYVVCRQLGFGTARNSTLGVVFPPGDVMYWIERVECQGDEEMLDMCDIGGLGLVNVCPANKSAAGVICQEYEPTDNVMIRLMGSSNSFEGRVEVFHSGSWGTICSDQWELEEAEVACKQLGFNGAQVALDAKLLFGADTTSPVYLPGLQCHGTESNLAQCSRDGWLDDMCSAQDCDAGVVCLSRNTPADGDIRLVGGSSSLAGRLEVYHLGVWGTVCDDEWTEGAASVACRQLGFIDAVSALDSSDYGHATGPILLDNVRCTGREDKLVWCPSNDWGRHNCDHSEDVAIMCRDDTTRLSNNDYYLPMSTIIGIITACSIFVSCGLMIIRYVHHRQRVALMRQADRASSADRQTPIGSLRYPRDTSGLFVVNGMPIDPNMPPHDLQPPEYSSETSAWKPPEVPGEPPPSYEATVADYPDARTDGVSSPVAPDYLDIPLPNAVHIIQPSTISRHQPDQEDILPPYRPTNTPPCSPLPDVD